ncbi:4'-phosphopantetheinyl transferase family protein [Clavibacter sp. km3a]|uniref:4'-phosphopantetheinyl transferase family protein n=1 Tax=Clavibacter sp. km3a TaxID=3459135 RepID=UPI004041A1D3
MQPISRDSWEALLPGSVVVATADHDVDGVLVGDERDAVATALPARRAEFTTGRVLARRALDALGIRPASIPAARSGAPVWPPGVVGSITHCVGLRACAVGRRDEHAGIGIDATPARPLPGGVLARVADLGSPPVAAGLDALRAAGVGSPDSVLLAAAEAVAKARTSAHGGWHGIDGAHVALRPDGSFAVRARRGPAFAATGRWAVAGGMALAGIALDAHGSRSAGARRDG